MGADATRGDAGDSGVALLGRERRGAVTYRVKCSAHLVRRRQRWAERWLRSHLRTRKRSEQHPVKPTDGNKFWAEQREHGARSGLDWYGSLHGACPVQGFGECDDVPWYFRARGARWEIQFGVGEGSDGELH